MLVASDFFSVLSRAIRVGRYGYVSARNRGGAIILYSSRIRGQTVPQIDSTRHVCRISDRQTQQHRPQKSTRQKIQDEPLLSPYLPAASPSLSMGTSAMDRDRFVTAPHEPDGGARRPGLRALRSVLLFGAP
jgi:hypothetical protein